MISLQENLMALYFIKFLTIFVSTFLKKIITKGSEERTKYFKENHSAKLIVKKKGKSK